MSIVFPFDRPANYTEMLNKIGIFTFLTAFGLTWVVSQSLPAVAGFLNSQHLTVEIYSLHVPVLYAAPAVLIALVARIIRLHDRVSDLFRIRARFETYRVLIPLCGSVGIPVDIPLRNKLGSQRKSVMDRTFYAYASWDDPRVSKHLTLAAADLWTWYWILLEFIVLLAIAAAVLIVGRAYAVASLALIALFLATLLFSTSYGVCGKRVDQQIEEIVADAQRADALRMEFSEIRSSP